MKKNICCLIAVFLIMTAGCSLLGLKNTMHKTAIGRVTVDFMLTRVSGRGSNQYALWIEDENGRYIKTLYVTDYMTRRGGWNVRRQSLVNWVKAANLNNKPQTDIDALSRATPQTGRQSVMWNMKDSAGKTVTPGIYVYKIEACLLNENHILWSGKIYVGDKGYSSRATSEYFPEGADKLERTLISDVSADYNPVP
jgi:hypothetical protein